MKKEEKIFLVGKSFYDCGTTKPVPYPNKAIGLTPNFVNLCYAAELSLKCLIHILSGRDEHGHSIKKLFEKIPDKDSFGNDPKEIIKEKWKKIGSEQLNLENHLVGSDIFGEYKEEPLNDFEKEEWKDRLLDFDSFLESSTSENLDWRYIYEDDNSFPARGGDGMDYLYTAVKEFLFEIRPEFREL